MIATLKRLKKQRATEESDGGFTLIELLIVIVVLGILAAVVVFSLGSVTGNAAKAACASDVSTVNTGAAAYNANNGSFPALKSDLTGTTAGGPYIQSWPKNSHYSILYSAGVITVKGPLGTTVLGTYGGTSTNSPVDACKSVT